MCTPSIIWRVLQPASSHWATVQCPKMQLIPSCTPQKVIPFLSDLSPIIVYPCCAFAWVYNVCRYIFQVLSHNDHQLEAVN